METTRIFDFWQTSFHLFTNCDQRKNFILGTLSILRRALITLATKFWPIFTVFFVLSIFSSYINISIITYIIAILAASGFMYLGLMSLRPSIETKNYRYFLDYVNVFILITGISIVMPTVVWHVCFVPLVIFILFVLDSTFNVKNILYAFKKTGLVSTYCAPIFIAITMFFNIIGMLITMLCEVSFFYVLIAPIFLLFKLFILAAITTYYVKLKHEHFNLLFK